MNKQKMVRVMCLVIAGVMTFSVIAGVVMQVTYMMAA